MPEPESIIVPDARRDPKVTEKAFPEVNWRAKMPKIMHTYNAVKRTILRVRYFII